MAETNKLLLERYIKYIERLAKEKSTEIFTNGGIEYASQLMAVLFRHTENEARIFCQGFKPNLIQTEPYWSALNNFLSDSHKKFKVLVETDDYVTQAPILLLKQKQIERNNDGTISIRLVKEQDKQEMFKKLNGKPCNFAVFDNNKFRFEYEPDGYRAFGSFNNKENSQKLINLFDDAFEKANELN